MRDPAVDASTIYVRAAESLVAESPASSGLEYPEYPPFGPAWDAQAAKAWEANRAARDLARDARSIERASWPTEPDRRYLWKCHHIGIDLADAAIYQHLQGNNDQAMELVRDLLHLSKLLYQDATGNWYRAAVAVGVELHAARALMIIGSDLQPSPQPHAAHGQISTAEVRRLIDELVDQQDVESYVAEIFADEMPEFRWDRRAERSTDRERFAQIYVRSKLELTFAAVSLACHLYHTEHGRWPQTLPQLVPDHLPRVPLDPWGDGTQPLGYLLVKGGLPDGGDRPLVYSRDSSRDGLFFRTDRPHYMFYATDGSDRPGSQQKQGGQFRDIARWSSGKLATPRPATLPVQ